MMRAVQSFFFHDLVGKLSAAARCQLCVNIHICAKQCRTLRRQTPAPRHARHSKRTCTWDHFLSDFADTNQAECAAKQSACFRKLFLVPLSAPERYDVVRHAPVESKD